MAKRGRGGGGGKIDESSRKKTEKVVKRVKTFVPHCKSTIV